MFDQLSKGYRELDEDQEMVSPPQVCAMFVDWTDPQKAMYDSDTTPCARLNSSPSLFSPRGTQGQSPDQMVHVELATSILRALFKKDIPSKR